MSNLPSSASPNLSSLFGLSRSAERRALALLFVSTLVFGVVGFLQHRHGLPAAPGDSPAAVFLNALYHTMQLFILHTPLFTGPIPWTLELARWLAALTTVMAVASVARRMLREELIDLQLHRANRHVVVCGLGRKGIEQVRQLRQQRQPVVVIEQSPEAEHAEECRRLGVPIVAGDAAHPATLQEARVAQASALYALCPDDRTNCEIAAQVRHIPRSAAHGRLECHIHLGDVDLRAALQETLSQHPGNNDRIHFQLFDVFEPEVRQLLIHDLPLDHDGVGPHDLRPVHLVILGFGQMGQTLAVRAAQLGCFANRRRLCISVIDRHADQHRNALLFRHRHIGAVCDLEFHSLEVMSPAAWDLLEIWCADCDCLTSVAVCFDDEPRALEIALQLRPLLDDGRVRLAIRLARESGLAHLLAEAQKQPGWSGHLRPFGMEERWGRLFNPVTDPNEVFARRIHAEYERLTGQPAGAAPPDSGPPSHDDEVQRWLAQPEDFRESSRQQAAHIFIKLRAIGCEAVPLTDPRPAVTAFEAGELEMLAEWEHRRWMAERTVANWTYAPGKKNVGRRTNPNLVPWAELTPEIQKYDREFVRLIPRLLAAVGQKLCRRLPAQAT